MPPSGVTPGMARAAVARGSLSGIVPLDQSAYTLPASLLGLYLRRLGVDASKLAVDLTTLTMLQVAHVDRIAYENMSLHQRPGGTPSEQPELNPLASVMRVAAGGRGVGRPGNICHVDCSNRGTCKDGLCKCFKGFYGINCGKRTTRY